MTLQSLQVLVIPRPGFSALLTCLGEGSVYLGQGYLLLQPGWPAPVNVILNTNLAFLASFWALAQVCCCRSKSDALLAPVEQLKAKKLEHVWVAQTGMLCAKGHGQRLTIL